VASVTDPSGWKNFTDGAVLPANEVRGYLQQGILVFDNAAARDSTLVGFLREGMLAYTKDNDTVSFYTGAAWNIVTGQIEFASTSARDAAIPSPADGRYAFTTDGLRLWKYSVSATAWREVGVNVSFSTTAARDTAFPSPTNGQYVYITGILSTFQRSGGAWVKVGPDVETTKNILSFTGSSSTTVPAWATKMYYAIVAGGGSGNTVSGFPLPIASTGGNGGQVVQGNVAVSPGVTITVTVGGASANSSVAISGGSTFTATGAGGAAGGVGNSSRGTNGTVPSAPLNVARYGGGGAGTDTRNDGGVPFELSDMPGEGGGGTGNMVVTGGPTVSGQAGHANTGGGGSGGWNTHFGGGKAGGSGIVLLLFT
jgi:hypothetical protein